MRFALFGAGRVGRVHAQNIADHPNAELIYVFDIHRDAARHVGDKFDAEVAESADQIWEAEGVDAVLIASSTNTHVELLRGAIRSGKAVYCEKPIDLDLDIVKSVAQEAHHTKVPIFLGFRRRFIPEVQAIYDRMHNGDLGALEVMHIISRDSAPPPISYINVSGGFLRDKTIHYFDLVCWLTGESPVQVYANGSCLVDPNIGAAGDIDTVLVTLKMPSGALCQIENGRRSVYGYDERIEVSGALGMLQWNPFYERAVSQFSHSGITLNRSDPDSVYFKQESFAVALDAFINCVRSGKELQPSLLDGVRAQVIAEAATESLKKDRPVTISYWQPNRSKVQ